ncbi:MAG: chromate transporter [Oscillospiraceae bacterium]|nr:chromate transporter [Oscillospiraceae bacterium]
MKRKTLTELFLTFLKVGMFTFGGGYAMISVITNACVEQKKWLTHDEMMDMTVIAESTPGPIAINCATYVGYRQAGFSGAVAATAGMVVPSFVIIYLISMVLENFMEITIIASAFQGIKIAVGLLIVNAAVTMLRKMKKTPLACVLSVCSCAAMLLINIFSWKISSVSLMLIAGVISLVACTPQKEGGAA